MKKIRYILRRYRRNLKYLWRGLSYEEKKGIVTGIIMLFGGVMIGSLAGHHIGSKQMKAQADAEIASLNEELETLKVEYQETKESEGKEDAQSVSLPWYLTLVNYDHPMQDGYVPQLSEVRDGYSVDSRIVDAAKEMLNAASAEGLNIIVCSAYRSVDYQKQVFNTSMGDRLQSGMSYLEAYQDTAKSVAVPGTSEHALGLALDLISNQYSGLNEKQQETKEAKWLAENCHKYGFILRYPPEKTDITGIIYEPWHYRYVGVEDATKIMQLGITLEEYLQEYYG